MLGLSPREMRFTVVISATHLTQHFLGRLVPPLIPILAVAMQYPLWQLGLLISLYSFGSGLAQAPLGVAADRYDRRILLPAGIGLGGAAYLLFASASLFGGIVPDLTLLGYTFESGFLVMSVAMLFVGVGTAVVHPIGYPLISDNVSTDNKGKVLGVFGSSSMVGDALAPALIAVMILVFAWEQIIFVLGGACVVFAVALYLSLRSDEFKTVPAAQREEDSAKHGVVNPEDDDEPEEATGVTSENSSDSILRGDRRTYLYPMIVIYVFFVTKKFASDGIKTFLPAFLVAVYAYSFDVMDVQFGAESVANFYFSALLLFAAVTQLGIGGVTDRYDARTVIMGCVAAATVGFLLLAMFDLGPVLLLLVLLLLGGGIWGLSPARDALISDISPPEREGRTFGYIWTAVHIVGTAMPVLVGYVMDTMGMREGFMILAGGTLLAGLSISLLFLDRVYAEPGATVSAEASAND